MLVEAGASDITTSLVALLEGGGFGGVVVVAWRIGTALKSVQTETKKALEEWRKEAGVRRDHYTDGARILKEMQAERSQRDAEATVRGELKSVRSELEDMKRRLDREEMRGVAE